MEILVIAIIEFLAVLLGVFLGYKYSIRQDREIHKEDETEKKDQVVTSIIGELFMNHQIIENMLVSLDFSTITFDILMTSCFQSAVNSGHFSLLSPNVQGSLNYYYHTINKFNTVITNTKSDNDFSENLHLMKNLLEWLERSYMDTSDSLENERAREATGG